MTTFVPAAITAERMPAAVVPPGNVWVQSGGAASVTLTTSAVPTANVRANAAISPLAFMDRDLMAYGDQFCRKIDRSNTLILLSVFRSAAGVVADEVGSP